MFLNSQITPAGGLALRRRSLFNTKMAWPGWRKKQSLMSSSVLEVGANLGIIKRASSKTTSFPRVINHQIILASCTFLSRGDALEYCEVWTTARLK